MSAEIWRRCNAVEECYEFMLAYAAQGVSSGDGSHSRERIREILQRAADSLSGLPDACATMLTDGALEPADKYLAFFAVIDRDRRDALAAIELALAQPSISSQMVDNLNASVHLRALLTDLFLLTDFAKQHTGAA
jgi:hypothetical protein